MALKNIMPKMTSNNSPAPYVVSCTDSAGDATGIVGPLFKAFDRDIITYLRTPIDTYSKLPCVLKIDLGEENKQAVVAYQLINNIYPQWSMNTWTFEGSNDNSNWTVLHTVTNKTTWKLGIEYLYQFENEIPYRYYRFKCTEVNGNNSIVISEAKLFIQTTVASEKIKTNVINAIKNHELTQKHLISILMEE